MSYILKSEIEERSIYFLYLRCLRLALHFMVAYIIRSITWLFTYLPKEILKKVTYDDYMLYLREQEMCG